MIQHPYFDLWLHTTQELSDLLSTRVVERITLHEWPLSCVQRLHLDHGEKVIYKAQFAEGVEAEFYKRVSSQLLPGHRLLGGFKNTSLMLLEFIDAPLLEDLELDEEHKVIHGQQILSAISEMEEDVPVYQDFSTPARWEAYAAETIGKLGSLIDTGKFSQTDRDSVKELATWTASKDVITLAGSVPALLHADLSSDNIFVVGDGYRVIDWQYPRRGPAEVDYACFLEGVDLDPRQYVTPQAAGMFWFMRLNWLVECKMRLFPQGESYDQQVAELAQKILG